MAPLSGANCYHEIDDEVGDEWQDLMRPRQGTDQTYQNEFGAVVLLMGLGKRSVPTRPSVVDVDSALC